MFYTLNSSGCNEITALLSQAVPVCFLLMFEVLDRTSANGLIVRASGRRSVTQPKNSMAPFHLGAWKIIA